MSKLSELYEFQYGRGNNNPDNGGKYPIYGSNGIIGGYDIYNSEDSPVIGHIGANCGEVVFARGKHYVTYNGVICKTKPGVNRKYAYYVLLNSKLKERVRGSAQPFISYDLLNDVDVNIPNKTVQKKIGDILWDIDTKIENNNIINVELEAMARTIYDYWFLQFDFPDENGKPYKSSGGKMVWNEELKREIPEGWRVGNLSEIALITMGSSPKGDSLNEDKDGIIFYQGKTDFGYRFPMVRMYTKSPIRYAEVYDILLSVRAPVGDMNIAGEKCCIGRGLAAIHSRYQSFLFYLMLRNQYQFDKYNNKGTTFGAITKDELFGMRVVIPDKTIIEFFDKKIGDLDKRIFINEMQNHELISLRDFLLPLLMNGQVGFK